MKKELTCHIMLISDANGEEKEREWTGMKEEEQQRRKEMLLDRAMKAAGYIVK